MRPTLGVPAHHVDWTDRIAFDLRVVMILASKLYAEHGAARMRVRRLVDPNVEPYRSGFACDIEVTDLPGVKITSGGTGYKVPAWICKRLNLLFPFGDGDLETATYDGAKITLRCPMNGYGTRGPALSTWFEFGAPGKPLPPRKLDI